MRRVVPALLLVAVCAGFASACSASGGGTPVGSENSQQQFVQTISDEQNSLGQGSMDVYVPTNAVQSGTGVLTVTISENPGGAATVTATQSGSSASASATASVATTGVKAGGMMGVQTTCTGMQCTAVGSDAQPVTPGTSATWTWDLTYGQSGTATADVVAMLYQGDSTSVLWQSTPMHAQITINATAQEKVDRSLGWLHDTLISIGGVIAALIPIGTVLYKWRNKRKRQDQGGAGPAAAKSDGHSRHKA